MKLLELEAAHDKKHAQEDVERRRREMKCKPNLAALEFKICNCDICENDLPIKKRDKTNTNSIV